MSVGVRAALGVGAIVVVGVLVGNALMEVMPGRMPPDPFENDEPRVVELYVEWHIHPSEITPRTQSMAWDVGDDVGEENDVVGAPGPEGELQREWRHITTAREGTMARLASVQSALGTMVCEIRANGRLLAGETTDQLVGCLVEERIP